MKKNAHLFIIILVGISIFSSCSKNDQFDAASPGEDIAVDGKKPAASPNLRVHTRKQGNDLRTYIYDASGRVIESSSAFSNSAFYEYVGNQVNYNLYYPGGTLASAIVYDLNSKGLAAVANGSTLTGYYTYNNKKQLIAHEVHFTNGDIAEGDFDYIAGNLTKITSNLNGSPSWNKTFTYYNDQPNHLDNETFGAAYLGAESKNLVKSMVFVISNGTTTTEEYSYEFDTSGRVSKVKTIKNGLAQADILYTYY